MVATDPEISTDERLERLEHKLDALVSTLAALLERFQPLLEYAEKRAGRRVGRYGGGARVRDDESGGQ